MIDLEQIEHDITVAKSPNITHWLLPIDTIEQMLALIRKQEVALKESQELVAAQVRTVDELTETIERLRNTITGMQSRMGAKIMAEARDSAMGQDAAAVVTVDTTWPEAWHALRDDVLSGVDGLDNDQVNIVLGMLDNYEPCQQVPDYDSEYAKASSDANLYGTGFVINGRRVAPDAVRVIKAAAPQQPAYRYIRPDEVCIVGRSHDGKSPDIDLPIFGDGAKDGKRLFIVALPAPAAQVAVPDLPDQIMRIATNYKGDLNFRRAYLEGHRDARHAAAELAAAALDCAPSPAQPAHAELPIVLELPEGDTRTAKIGWHEVKDGKRHICISVSQPAPGADSAPDAAFAAFCDREGYPSDGPFDSALRKAFDAGVTLMVSHACRTAQGEALSQQASEVSEEQIDAAIKKLGDLDAQFWSRGGTDARYMMRRVLNAALNKQEPTA